MVKTLIILTLVFLFVKKWKRTLAVVDIFCNVMFDGLFNRTLITKNSKHKFGWQREWVSSVIGKNLQAGTLTKTGMAINKFLNLIQKDHAIKQIVT